jgi:hypothetical protein
MARRTDQPRNLEGDLPAAAPEVNTTHPGSNASPGQKLSGIRPPRSREDPQPVVTLATTTDHIPLQTPILPPRSARQGCPRDRW